MEQRLSDRTLLVYMGGDNDLADETDEKLSALTEAWDRFPGHLLIYQDKKGADSTRSVSYTHLTLPTTERV